MQDIIKHKTLWTIRKYENDDAFKAEKPYDVVPIEGNLLLNEGITELLNLLISATENRILNAAATRERRRVTVTVAYGVDNRQMTAQYVYAVQNLTNIS